MTTLFMSFCAREGKNARDTIRALFRRRPRRRSYRYVRRVVSFLHNVCSDYAYDANVRAALFVFAFLERRLVLDSRLRKTRKTRERLEKDSKHPRERGDGEDDEERAAGDADLPLRYSLRQERAADDGDERRDKVPETSAGRDSDRVLRRAQRDGRQHAPIPPLGDEHQAKGLPELPYERLFLFCRFGGVVVHRRLGVGELAALAAFLAARLGRRQRFSQRPHPEEEQQPDCEVLPYGKRVVDRAGDGLERAADHDAYDRH
mmetsp:Transcript_14361/g.60511  ORF Transcript_14361/g.60511 Transcript_14361/m.60511 type:complete len:261 (-) Transcript_14361:507-1289(-)